MLKDGLGVRISVARETAAKTQQEVAEALGVKRETVAQWENGTRQIKAEALAGLAEYLSVSADYLLGLTEAKSSNTTIREVCEFTGLADETVEYLNKTKCSTPQRLKLLNALCFDDGLWYEDIADAFAAAMELHKEAESADASKMFSKNQDGTVTIDTISAYRFFVSRAAMEFSLFMDWAGDLFHERG